MAAFRCLVPLKDVLADPEAKKLFEGEEGKLGITRCSLEERKLFVVAYPVSKSGGRRSQHLAVRTFSLFPSTPTRPTLGILSAWFLVDVLA